MTETVRYDWKHYHAVFMGQVVVVVVVCI